MTLKSTIRSIANRFGYDITRRSSTSRGLNPFLDMQAFLTNTNQTSPLIFDVGANLGQTVTYMRNFFPDSVIHSFEPSPDIYQKLIEKCEGMGSVHTWNCGLGAKQTTATLNENELPGMNSILELGSAGWGKVKKQSLVDIQTIDEFCESNEVDHIDILKSDTQGYDLEVFKGAADMLNRRCVKLIFVEIIFSAMYEGLPSFNELYRFLSDFNFSLVSFYTMHHDKGIASWTDAVFIERDFHAEWQNAIR